MVKYMETLHGLPEEMDVEDITDSVQNQSTKGTGLYKVTVVYEYMVAADSKKQAEESALDEKHNMFRILNKSAVDTYSEDVNSMSMDELETLRKSLKKSNRKDDLQLW